MAPGYRRVLTIEVGKISFAISWQDVTSIGFMHIPLLHGTLKFMYQPNKKILLTKIKIRKLFFIIRQVEKNEWSDENLTQNLTFD